MKKKNNFFRIGIMLLSFTIMPSFVMLSPVPVRADVPAPPVNQIIGTPDSVFNNLTEAECRFCHEDPNIVGGPNNVDRHDLYYGTPLIQGFCSIDTGLQCTTASDCNIGEECIGGTDAPYPPSADGTYECTTCHAVLSGGQIDIETVKDCMFCHMQNSTELTVHHFTAEAQSQNCQYCHGSLVNNIGDGHIIPTYEPSLVTPNPSGGNGLPLNVEGSGTGGCDYCHSSGTGQPGVPGFVSDPAFTGPYGPVLVYDSSETHHSTGLGLYDTTQCTWCHNIDDPGSDPIRRCEGCHGFESLHNIAVDSDDPDSEFNPAGSPNEENPGWSHVGNNDDCWGCHGFSAAGASSSSLVNSYSTSAVSGMGPFIPYINSADSTVVKAGSETTITLRGVAFTNFNGNIEWVASIVLTSDAGIETELAPDFVSENLLTVTIPETMTTGNYHLRAVKGAMKSNPFVISVIPDVVITDVDCDKNSQELTITGSGFGKRPAGTEAYMNVEINGDPEKILSWTDREIITRAPKCNKLRKSVVTVNALFGSATGNMSNGNHTK